MPSSAGAQQVSASTLYPSAWSPPAFDIARLTASQAEWTSQQWSFAAQAGSGLLSALFDAQAAAWRSTEALMRAGLQPWVAADPGPLAVESTLETPDDLSPPALFQRTATAWLILGKACMNALEHDLQEAEPIPTAAPRRRRAARANG
ncbi:MAG: hypothetical protein KIT60_08420 [Burkholderiaceae bacterium]|nr:hypothetical protein [Burkholderiaceae bacterium]